MHQIKRKLQGVSKNNINRGVSRQNGNDLNEKLNQVVEPYISQTSSANPAEKGAQNLYRKNMRALL